MFAAEFEAAETDGRRRSPRSTVSLEAQIGRDGRTLCKVVDVSLHGAKLMTYSALRRGATIWLKLPHVGHVAAQVRWADEFGAGIQFETALDPRAYTSLLREAGEPPEPR